MKIIRLASITAVTLTLTALLATTVSATHSWGGYHWARTSNPFTLTVVNSTTSDWDPYVAAALADWILTNKPDDPKILGFWEDYGSESNKVRRQCSPPSGQIRICNLAYGQTGWLGVAGIWVDAYGHITKGYTKLNDTYFSSSPYNTGDWKQTVTCQELGHDFGLDHQDEDFYNDPLLTCMDYQVSPFPYPNSHDYEELGIIYGHTDSYNSYVTNTGGSGSGGDGGGCTAPAGRGCNKATVGDDVVPHGWGVSLGRRGNQETFVHVHPDGSREVTHVLWAD